VERHAREKRARKGLPMIVANDVRHAVGGDDNEVTIHDDEGAHAVGRASKSEIARRVVEHAAALAERRALATKVAAFKQAS
jgi:phosphopantothenoylcysteine decarboxylase/phosphopantothenate--cysteine ligase